MLKTKVAERMKRLIDRRPTGDLVCFTSSRNAAVQPDTKLGLQL